MKKALLRHLRQIEAQAYPEQFQMLQAVFTTAQLADYCEGTPHLLTWDTGYLLVTREEVVDLASIAPVPLARLMEILRFCRGHFGDRVISLDARDRTSAPLLRAAARRRLITILCEEPWYWGEEQMFHMDVVFC